MDAPEGLPRRGAGVVDTMGKKNGPIFSWRQGWPAEYTNPLKRAVTRGVMSESSTADSVCSYGVLRDA